MIFGYCFALAVTAVAAWVDMRCLRIPDWLVFPSMAFALIFLFSFHRSILPRHLASAGIALAILFCFWLSMRAKFGLGDVKLMTFLVLVLGPLPGWIVLFAACVMGIAAFIFLRHSRGPAPCPRHLPFAPFLFAGTAVAFLVYLFSPWYPPLHHALIL